MLAEHPVLFVWELGGIGKSALVQNYCAKNTSAYDIIIYLQYERSLQNTFIRDELFHIHTVSKQAEESEAEYFERKLRHLKDLAHGKRVLLVLDNYEAGTAEELFYITKQGWHVIVVSRRIPVRCSFPGLQVEAIADRKLLRQIFEQNLGRTISEKETAYFDQILSDTAGHTLILALIARQISNSHLSLKEAAHLTLENGFSNIAPEK